MTRKKPHQLKIGLGPVEKVNNLWRKVAPTSAESDSDGEIKDDDDDAISVDYEDEDDELLKELASEIDNTGTTSEKVAASMADIINKRFSQSLTDEKLKTKLDQYDRPDNCERLVFPTVNNEVWRNLPPQAKKADLKLALTQRATVKASVAAAQSTQLVLRAHTKKTLTDKSTKDDITNKTADAFALLGHACNELSLRRRYALKPHLPTNLAGLCSSTVSFYFPTVWGQSLRLREGGKGAGETDPGHKLIWARQTQVVQQTVQSGQAFFRSAQPASVRSQEAVQLRPAELPQKESGDQQQQTEQLNPEEVSLSLDMICLKETLRSEVTLFRGGRLAHFLYRWKTITSDPEILGIVKGLELEFDCPLGRLPKSPPSQPRLSDTEIKVIDAEIKNCRM